ncbi:MAG: DUF3168 domain-containing protein, partial [Alteromonas macleodii]
MSFQHATQKAIYNRLTLSSDLMSMVKGVFDFVEEDQQFPYVTIGEASHNEFDTYSELGSEVVVTIHTWSREQGNEETHKIQGQIYNALNRAELGTVDDYYFIGIHFETSDILPDNDGLTFQGVQTFRI